MTGDHDADLYVRKGSAPTTAVYDCRPYKDGSIESCGAFGDGPVYVGVRGYATFSHFSLTIVYDASD